MSNGQLCVFLMLALTTLTFVMEHLRLVYALPFYIYCALATFPLFCARLLETFVL